MTYLKPSLGIVGSAEEIVLGSSTGAEDSGSELPDRKPFDIAAGLDD
jgi:hypothetical protein